MEKIVKLGKILLVIVVLLLAYWLRVENFENVPTPGQSLDEYSYSWVGLSLIELGVPVGISGIDGYKVNDLRYINVDRIYQRQSGMGTPLTLNYPWFDHPPMMGLITGGYAYMKGARVFEEASTFLIRKPMVYIGTLSTGLVFVLGYLIWGYKSGLVGSIVYATSPLVVISSRMIQAENGLIPMMLLSLIFLILFVKKQSWKWLWLSAVFAGIGVLFKLSGVSVFVAGFLTLLLNKNINRKICLVVYTVVFGCIASLFVIYGWVYDGEIFRNIFVTNSQRFYGIGSAAVYNLLVQTKVTGDKYLTDAWPLAGMIAAFILLAKRKLKVEENIVGSMMLSYLAIYLFLGSESYGWYALPLWPLSCLALGNVLVSGYKDSRRMAVSLVLLLLPIGVNLNKILNYQEFQKYSSYWKYGLLLLIWGTLYFRLKRNNMNNLFFKALLISILAGAIILNIKVMEMMSIDYWYKVN